MENFCGEVCQEQPFVMIAKPHSSVMLETTVAGLKFIIHTFAVLLENIYGVYRLEDEHENHYNKICIFKK